MSRILDEIAPERVSLLDAAYDGREFDPRTNSARAAFNAASSPAETRTRLLDSGWESTAKQSGFEKFARDDRDGYLVDDADVFIDNDTLTLTPFDLMVLGSEHDPIWWANHLLETGEVSVLTPVLEARGARPRLDDSSDTVELIKAFVERLKTAVMASDRAMPLAFVRMSGSTATGICSVTPAGQLRKWEPSTASQLLAGAAQLTGIQIRADGSEKITPRHSVPHPIIQGVLEALQSPGALRPLELVATEPIVTEDGVAAAPGYHRALRAVILIPHRDRAKWRAEYQVPERPTRAEAQAAYELLDLEILSSFAFVSPTDRARGMAYLLTATGRNLINGSPAFNATAPDRGTGKSLLLLIGRILSQGSPQATSFQVGQWANEETEKRLASLALAGGRFLHCDEALRGVEVKGTVLTAAITAIDGENRVRILGGSTEVSTGGMIVTLAGSGTNLGGDMNRRFITIGMQRPMGFIASDNTEYRHPDLVKWALKSRPMLLAAAHTVLLHGIQNRAAQRKIPTMGFSHDWAEVMLGSMSWLTTADGADAAAMVLKGWDEEVAQADTLGEAWGPFAQFAWNAKPLTWLKAADLHAVSLAVPLGVLRPALPKELDTFGPVSRQVIEWGHAFKSMSGARISFEGIEYRFTQEQRSGASRASRRYMVEAFERDGTPLKPGVPHPNIDLLAERGLANLVDSGNF